MKQNVRKLLCAMVAATLLTTTVRASAEVTGVPVSIHISENYTDNSDNERGLLFLFSNASITRPRSTDIWLVFSKARIGANVTGRIYALFSDVIFEDCVSTANFTSISSTAASGFPLDVNAVFPVFSQTDTLGYIYTYRDTIPLILIQSLVAIFQVLVMIVFFFAKKSFVEQGSVLLLYEPLSVIKNGLRGYSILLLLIIIFAIALVTIPVALVLLFLLYVVTLIGEVQLAVLLGYSIADKLGKRGDSFFYMLLGVIIIESLKLLPYTGWPVSMLFLPIAAVGCALSAFINGFYLKKFYELPFRSSRI